MRGYKVFNNDWTCKDFKYEVGETYEMDLPVSICRKGFHFCEKLVDCFNYYQFNSENKVAEVEAIGQIETDGSGKSVTNKIKIAKELTWHQVLELVNTGHSNSGHRNSGDSNSGNRNSGNRNSGYRNSGHRNSGDSNSGNWNSGDSNSGYNNSGDSNSGDWNSGNWNSCDYETGSFNTIQSETIRVFNNLCNRREWIQCEKPDFIYFDLTKVIDNKLVLYGYKEAFQNSYEQAKRRSDFDEQIELLKALPNFDADVFYEISGIRV